LIAAGGGGPWCCRDFWSSSDTESISRCEYELGSMELKQAKLDKDLGHTLSLEKYGDEDAIEELSKKLAASQEMIRPGRSAHTEILNRLAEQ